MKNMIWRQEWFRSNFNLYVLSVDGKDVGMVIGAKNDFKSYSGIGDDSKLIDFSDRLSVAQKRVEDSRE